MLKRAMMLLPVLLFITSPALARSYSLNRIEVVAEVRDDGSMRVSETREVAFKGTYHAFDREIPLPPGTHLTGLVVSEAGTAYREDPSEAPGTYHSSLGGGKVVISWGYSATDEVRSFVLEYTISGAVVKHADAAELYWQFIEPTHDWRAETSRVTVNLPGAVAASDINAWAHGVPWGKVEPADGLVVLTCDPLPRNEMVEARILFPAEVIAYSPRQDSSEVRDSVMAEEGEWAREANAARRVAKIVLIAKWAFPILLAVGAIVTWVALYASFGREHKPATEIEYLRDIPNDWTPNQVACVWRWGELGPNDMTATLMDLVRRGALRLIVTTESHRVLGGLLGEKTEQEYVIERVSDYRGEMSDSERYLMSDVLFHDVTGDTVAMETFQKKARGDPRGAQGRFKTWKKQAKEEAKRMELIDPASKRASIASAVIGFVLFGGSIVLGGMMGSPAFILTGIVGFALMPGSYAILRRTPEAAEALHRWQAFRRYLTDFSRLKEYPAPAVTLWEQYLVYAITLGVADKVIEQFKELYPQVAATTTAAAFPHWVGSGGTPLSGMDSIGSVLSSFNSTLATATSSFSSSSGSGGGFSGGGGGGGGGGSSGAR